VRFFGFFALRKRGQNESRRYFKRRAFEF